MDIDSGQTYQIKAERPDDKSSQVTLSTPEEFPTPLFQIDIGYSGVNEHIYSIIMRGTDKIVDVQTWWFVQIKSGGNETVKKFTFSYRDQLVWTGIYGGAYIADFVYEEEEKKVMNSPLIRLSPNAEVEILHRQVYVAAGGPEWDEKIPALDDLVYAQPDVASNVENGLGYMIGVYSKIVPYKSCFTEGGGALIPCEVEKPYW